MLSATGNRPAPRFTPRSASLPSAVLSALLAFGCSDSSSDAPTDPGTNPGPAPVVTGQPRDTSVVEGSTATFTVTATGALAYQWIKDVGDTLRGDTAATLTLTNIPLSADGSTYKCVVGNAEGSVTSSFAILGVTASPASLVPAITAQPLGTHIVPEATALLHVGAAGPGLTYQWYRWNSQNPIAGGTSPTLVVVEAPFPNVSIPYYCVVANVHGTVTTDTVFIRADATRSFLLDTGAVVFARQCAGCHGANGRGVAGSIPPVANADFLMQNRRRSLEIVLAGAADSLLVNGMKYGAAMPGFSETLSAVQIAAVLTYLRAGLNDSTVGVCNPGQLDGNGFPVCQKTARAPQAVAADSVSYQEVFAVRDSLFPL